MGRLPTADKVIVPNSYAFFGLGDFWDKIGQPRTSRKWANLE